MQDLWRLAMRHKVLFFGGIAVLLVLLYLWWQNNAAPAPEGGAFTTNVDTGQGSGVPGVVTTDPQAITQPVVNTSSSDNTQAPSPVANWFGVGVPFVSPAPVSVPGQAAGSQGPRTYLVVAGDTLHGVARKLGLTANQLYNDNRGVISLASSKHGGSYWDTGKATKSPPAGVKLYPGTILSY